MIQKYYKLLCLFVLIVSCTDTKIEEIKETKTTPVVSVENYKGKSFEVYTTAKDTELRLTKTSEGTFKDKVQPTEAEIFVAVNPKKTFQEYLGIGGAITDASAEVFSTLNETQQEKLLQSYFGKDGIGYNIVRTSIHSSDFGLGSHTYVEEGDTELKTFSIEKDREKRLPFIKKSNRFNRR